MVEHMGQRLSLLCLGSSILFIGFETSPHLCRSSCMWDMAVASRLGSPCYCVVRFWMRWHVKGALTCNHRSFIVRAGCKISYV